MRRTGGTGMPYQIEFLGRPQSVCAAVDLSRPPESGAIAEAHRADKLANAAFASSKSNPLSTGGGAPSLNVNFCPVAVLPRNGHEWYTEAQLVEWHIPHDSVLHHIESSPGK